MPATANTTEKFPLTNAWQVLGTDGDIWITYTDSFHTAISPSGVTPPSVEVRGNPANRLNDGTYREDVRLASGQFLWIRASRVDGDAYVTVTNPV